MMIDNILDAINHVRCLWMSQDGILHDGTFQALVLVKAEDDEKHMLQQQIEMLNMRLNLKKLETFKNQIQQEKIGLSKPGQSFFTKN